MPFNHPGSLTHAEVYAVVAHLLHSNGIVGEKDVMSARTLAKVKMPNRDGFIPDPRPDVGRHAPRK
jgi:cytochrome c